MVGARRRRHPVGVTSRTPVPRLAHVVDLADRRRRREDALARAAAAPVLHITPEFLAALNCRDGEAAGGPSRAHLRVV